MQHVVFPALPIWARSVDMVLNTSRPGERTRHGFWLAMVPRGRAPARHPACTMHLIPISSPPHLFPQLGPGILPCAAPTRSAPGHSTLHPSLPSAQLSLKTQVQKYMP
ncbi:hypothetical protein AAFF_G00416960 [Aldrovandia affinis]|uniref:Uncharacterized protein n=1 Tax=Aldrovandia affinis TaxID=143900 RepID=A0AAD7WK69_9TELE|nr:hypothetical protein AAFF_G00416960 [Aldrovandia affinis]